MAAGNDEKTALDRFCTDVGKTEIIRDAEVERYLVRLYRVNKSRRARALLTQSCLRFVVKLASRYAHGSMDRLTDLVAAGNEGVLVAIEHFDPTRDVRLLTYATSWILLHIRREFQKSTPVAVPTWYQRAHWKVHAANQKEILRTGSPPTIRKLCRQTGLSAVRVKRLLAENLHFVSLDLPDQTGHSLLSSLPDTGPLADELLQKKETQELVRRLVDKLPETPRFVLYSYFGFDCEPMTSQKIGVALGVSRERARQIQQQALLHLRKKILLELSRAEDKERADCSRQETDAFLSSVIF